GRILVAAELLAEAASPPLTWPSRDAVSHIFFTSGSTGRPKGCCCSFGNLEAYCRAKNRAHQVDRQSVVFVGSAHTFDPSLGDFFSTWLAGACLAQAEGPLGPGLLRTRASHVQATPAHFATVEADRVYELQTVALGGELMPQPVLDTWAGRVRLLNTYGVTECTVYQAFAALAPGASRRRLGEPLETAELRLAKGKGDDPDQCVEEGSEEIGELWIFGAQVGLGYLRRPELTAERFRHDADGRRGFRSGDLAVSKASGEWHLLGRRDGMVKLRGRRVELGEVEEVAQSVAPELLASACCVLVEGLLVLYCVLQGGSRGELAACALVKTLLAERLPTHMVPARVVPVEELPLTSSGKVSRRALAQWALPPLALGASAPRTGAAEQVAAAWREVLGVSVTLRSDFLALGGDSMAALRVCQRLAMRCELDGGTFGEALPEPLLPGHLLSKPRLADYLQHLQRSVLGSHFAAPEEAAEEEEEEDEVRGDELMSRGEVLHYAAGVGATEVLRILLRPGLLPERNARSPLHAACLQGHLEAAQLLLQARACAGCQDSKGVQPLHLAAFGGAGHALELLRLLLAHRAAGASADAEKQTALHWAARGGAKTALLEELLKEGPRKGRAKGFGVDAQDAFGRSPLHWAVVNGHRRMRSSA
ncbi:unnamed protein product, partial [Effrenium voratum]